MNTIKTEIINAIKENDKIKFETILKQNDKALLTDIFNKNRGILYRIINNDAVDMLKLLLEHDIIDVNFTIDNDTLLKVAIESDWMPMQVQEFLKKINAISGTEGWVCKTSNNIGFCEKELGDATSDNYYSDENMCKKDCENKDISNDIIDIIPKSFLDKINITEYENFIIDKELMSIVTYNLWRWNRTNIINNILKNLPINRTVYINQNVWRYRHWRIQQWNPEFYQDINILPFDKYKYIVISIGFYLNENEEGHIVSGLIYVPNKILFIIDSNFSNTKDVMIENNIYKSITDNLNKVHSHRNEYKYVTIPMLMLECPKGLQAITKDGTCQSWQMYTMLMLAVNPNIRIKKLLHYFVELKDPVSKLKEFYFYVYKIMNIRKENYIKSPKALPKDLNPWSNNELYDYGLSFVNVAKDENKKIVNNVEMLFRIFEISTNFRLMHEFLKQPTKYILEILTYFINNLDFESFIWFDKIKIYNQTINDCIKNLFITDILENKYPKNTIAPEILQMIFSLEKVYILLSKVKDFSLMYYLKALIYFRSQIPIIIQYKNQPMKKYKKFIKDVYKIGIDYLISQKNVSVTKSIEFLYLSQKNIITEKSEINFNFIDNWFNIEHKTSSNSNWLTMMYKKDPHIIDREFRWFPDDFIIYAHKIITKEILNLKGGKKINSKKRRITNPKIVKKRRITNPKIVKKRRITNPTIVKKRRITNPTIVKKRRIIIKNNN